MPGFARLDSPGVLQHVIVPGNERKKIFLDNEDRRRSLAEARGMICYVGVRELGYTGMELGRELN